MPGLGFLSTDAGFLYRQATSDGRFRVGADGVQVILSTSDRKVEFVAWSHRTLAFVTSAMGYPAYYPVVPVRLRRPVRAVLMDLDGTSVRSEEFWMWIIQRTIASLLGSPRFELEEADRPYVSGHSVSEHLQYCLQKYCPAHTVEEARRHYFRHARRELDAILKGRGRVEAFKPRPGLKPFLLALKRMGVKIGLVTSGVHEKAWPEIVAAFRTLRLGDPRKFYDAIVTAGFPVGAGEPGTLGELSPKPHPWLYAEVARVGLGIPFDQRHAVVGIEDSGAGVCAIRLAGFTPIGMEDGNIAASGTHTLCARMCRDFNEALEFIRGS